MAEYFFELLTEEIPAWMHDAAQATLIEKLSDLMATLGITQAETDAEPFVVVSFGSRRFSFVLRNFPLKKEDEKQVVKGPPIAAAYKDGEPTAALNGFLKKVGA